MKDELGAKIMTKFVGLKAKTEKSKKLKKVCYQKNT